MKNSFTLIEVLVGTFLITIVFFGIFGGFQLGLDVIQRSKARVGALAIANKEIENIRNLPYESVGTVGGFPEGVLETSTTTRLNNINYTIEKRIDFTIDPVDGVSLPQDECPNDFKKAEVKVSWQGASQGQIYLVTDISPKDLNQECASIGGIISVSVFDAFGAPVPFPLIEVKNPLTDLIITTAIPEAGQHYFSLATSTYKIAVSKAGFNSERTYGTEEVAIPEKPHPLAIEDQLTEISFFIDRVSSFSVSSLSPWGQDDFSDTFSDASKISDLNNVIVGENKIILAADTQGYLASGEATSIAVNPANIIQWEEFIFSDSEPIDTNVEYQFFFASGTDWILVPDEDLAGNSAGFDEAPVDLSLLPTSTYSQIKIKGNLFSDSTSSTPVILDWQISWRISEATPIPGATFNLQGQKILGLDAQENPIYKYSVNHASNEQGQIAISNLEWDLYAFSGFDPDLDLIKTEPEPQPISLAPDTALPVNLYFQAENSLLVTVQNLSTLEPVFSSQVRLFNVSLGYDVYQYSDEKGQTYFIPLQSAVYNLDISAAGYLSTSTTASVSGDNAKIIKLQQVE